MSRGLRKCQILEDNDAQDVGGPVMYCSEYVRTSHAKETDNCHLDCRTTRIDAPAD